MRRRTPLLLADLLLGAPASRARLLRLAHVDDHRLGIGSNISQRRREMRRLRGIGLALSFALLATLAVSQPVGAEFRINTYTTGRQTEASIAYPTADAFVVVWTSVEDGSGSSVQGQSFSSAGAPLGAPVRVNTFTSGYQSGARIASDGAGNFVVVWASYGLVQEGSRAGIYGQRFSGGLVPVGAEFSVNEYTTGVQYHPAVAMDASAGFVVVWSGGREVFGRRFNSSGAPLDDDFRVNTYTTNFQSNVRVASDSTGDFVVVSGGANPGGLYEIRARRFSSSGAPLGDDFRVNTYTTDCCVYLDVAADRKGGFIVVWDGPGSGRHFGASGAPLGDEFDVNTYAKWGAPSVTADTTGRFVVAWHRSATGPGGDLSEAYAQRFSASNAPIGSEFRVNTYTTGYQAFPVVASTPAGDFVVVWQGFGYRGWVDVDLFGQLFSGGVHGDADGDGIVNVSDVFFLINHLFAGGPALIGPADANGDGKVDVADVFYLINYLFAGGPAPK
jgi:hypothetical protein